MKKKRKEKKRRKEEEKGKEIMKLKLITIGPKGSGKTSISNYLLNTNNENLETDRYEPTIGTRILEGEFGNGNIQVELWDCSGDHK